MPGHFIHDGKRGTEISPRLRTVLEAQIKGMLESPLMKWSLEFIRESSPGHFPGDVFIVVNGREGQEEALERLCTNYFARRLN